MKPRPPIIEHHRIDQCIALTLAWLHWLAAVIDLLGDPNRSLLLRRHVKHIERKIELAVFAMAFKRAHLRPRPQARPFTTHRGFRRNRRMSYLALKSAGIRLRTGSIRSRIARLLEVMRRPGPFIAHYLKRIRAGLRGFRLVAAAPPAAGWQDAPPLQRAAPNSS